MELSCGVLTYPNLESLFLARVLLDSLELWSTLQGFLKVAYLPGRFWGLAHGIRPCDFTYTWSEVVTWISAE